MYIRSFSSGLMTAFLESAQSLNSEYDQSLVSRIGRIVASKIVVEVGLIGIAGLALMEGIVRVFTLPGFFLLQAFTTTVSSFESKCFYKELGSAWFVVAWATAYLVLNFFHNKLIDHESHARLYVGCEWLYREEEYRVLQLRLEVQAQQEGSLANALPIQQQGSLANPFPMSPTLREVNKALL